MAGQQTITVDTSGLVQGGAADASTVTTPIGDLKSAIEDTLNGAQVISQLNIGNETELTIAAGVITLTASHVTIDTQSDAATDDLDTINGSDGDIAFLRAEHTDRTVVIKNGTGNITCMGGGDITLSNTDMVAVCIHKGASCLVGMLSGQTDDLGGRSYKSTTTSISDDTTTALAMAIEDYDTDTMIDIGGQPTRITITTAGKYFIEGHCTWAANTTGQRQLGIRVDGTTVIATERVDATGAGTQEMNVSTIYNFTAAQYVELIAYQNSTGALDISLIAIAAQQIAG